MRKLNRSRLSVTVTIKQGVIDMLDTYSQKHGNRSIGVERNVTRYGSMIASADLSSISKLNFRMLCRTATLHGLDSENDPIRSLKSAMFYDMEQNREMKEDLEKEEPGIFPGDSAESRAEFIQKLDAEYGAVEELSKLLRKLDVVQLYALVEAIEEVLTDREGDLEATCASVYAAKFERSSLVQ